MLSWLNEGKRGLFHGWDRLVSLETTKNARRRRGENTVENSFDYRHECFRFSLSNECLRNHGPFLSSLFVQINLFLESSWRCLRQFLNIESVPSCLFDSGNRCKNRIKLSSINCIDNDERENLKFKNEDSRFGRRFERLFPLKLAQEHASKRDQSR